MVQKMILGYDFCRCAELNKSYPCYCGWDWVGFVIIVIVIAFFIWIVWDAIEMKMAIKKNQK